MDWFERLTGFRETEYEYEERRAKLKVEGSQLQSLINGKSYGIGTLELASLQNLRERLKSTEGLTGRLKVSVVTGDVREMHRSPQNVGALFQVASQFNLLEMVGPTVTPEQGVTCYKDDRTQGPACAIAAGAATIYRNYFAPLEGGFGQTKHRQFNGLAELGAAFAEGLNRQVETLWKMQNGYALCTRIGLDAIAQYLQTLQPQQLDMLRGKLRIGIHTDVEVPTTRRIIGRLFLKPSALPYPLPIQACRPHIGRHSRYSCCRRHTKQPWWPECSMHAAACQTLFCLRNLGEAPSATSLIGLILPCGGP
jgi:hypothetical protein